MKLTNRTILITGGTSGIGQEFARQLKDRGNEVIVTGRSQEKIDDLVTRIPGIIGIKNDVSSPADIQTLSEKIRQDFSNVDIVINNAGIMRAINLAKSTDQNKLAEEVNTNLMGPILLLSALSDHLQGKPSAALVNISSGLAYVPLPSAPLYSASKAGLDSFTKSMQIQFKNTNVSIIDVVPPMVDTPMNQNSGGPTRKMMKPEIFVKSVLENIEAGKTSIVVGESRILKFMNRIAPKMMLNQMAKLSG